jgi:hypothetical protein
MSEEVDAELDESGDLVIATKVSRHLGVLPGKPVHAL